jgi:hypothetical protein
MSTETLLHIKRVAQLLMKASIELLERAQVHDNSKLSKIESELFDIYTPMLKDLTFGSEEYYKTLSLLKPALDHHYTNNSHHPQYYKNGINDMNLFDIIEMLLDWLAATERHDDGDILKSIEINKKRFDMSEQLSQIFINTINFIQK